MISFKLFFETALGLVETIVIKDIGPVPAKVDSGNGAYNVLHGDDIQVDGNYITFTTINDIKLKKQIREFIDINIGSGNVERRPVALFDISVGGQPHPNTPFSIANRSENEQKVLLGKDFIEKLGGLIDVTKTNNVS